MQRAEGQTWACPHPLSRAWDQDTEDGTALFLLQALLTCGRKLFAAPLSRLPMDSSIGLCAARRAPGIGVFRAGRPVSFQWARSLRARKPQQPRKEKSRFGQNRARRAPVCTARGEPEPGRASQSAKVSVSILRLRREPAAGRGSVRLRSGERRALAQKVEAASAALGSMVGGRVCAWQVRPERGVEVTV